jgi:hypothetical protein
MKENARQRYEKIYSYIILVKLATAKYMWPGGLRMRTAHINYAGRLVFSIQVIQMEPIFAVGFNKLVPQPL